MLTRRHVLQAGLTTGCSVCAALAFGTMSRGLAAPATAPTEIDGPGYRLRFIGSQRETIMMGNRAALLDLRTLKGQPHLYGIGPIEGLSGEVAIADSRPSLARVGADKRAHVEESYEAGAPFFVWAEVPRWQDAPMPAQVRSFADLEAFIAEAGKTAALTQAFPFVVRGRPALIDFHIMDAKPETPPGMAEHQKMQIPFELHTRQATLVGFWSNQHRGIFTPMGTNIHIHFQTPENDTSGHVQGLDLGQGGMVLSLPKG
ncbi:MAG TPA: acetolactate decarboxylase [Rhizomicrobium sp.]|nr:acetolactate decarboxylase [Rhizomicrobium sp.]